MESKKSNKYVRLGVEDSDDSEHSPRSSLAPQAMLRSFPSSGLANLTNPLNRYQFNSTDILELCDTVRVKLQEHQSLGPRADEMLHLLRAMAIDESDGIYSIDMNTISLCRLDRLLSEMVAPDNGCSDIEITIANNLQRKWRLRFRQEYFDIDKARIAKLATRYGHLHDVQFRDTHVFAQGRWQAKRCESLSEVEGNQQFEPGHWWLNLACAARDGVVGATDEIPTKGRYGFTTLPLMSGKEEVEPESNIIRYSRDSKLSDAPVTLISQVGSKTRLLRGHCLKSPFAPRSGIRYDGLYIIRQYGQKLQPNTGLHRVVLRLERVPSQRSMEELAKIPLPSQMDDWTLFEKYEGEMIRKRQGNEAFTVWKVEKAQEKVDHSQWEKVARMTADLQQRKHVLDQTISGDALI